MKKCLALLTNKKGGIKTNGEKLWLHLNHLSSCLPDINEKPPRVALEDAQDGPKIEVMLETVGMRCTTYSDSLAHQSPRVQDQKGCRSSPNQLQFLELLPTEETHYAFRACRSQR